MGNGGMGACGLVQASRLERALVVPHVGWVLLSEHITRLQLNVLADCALQQRHGQLLLGLQALDSHGVQ